MLCHCTDVVVVVVCSYNRIGADSAEGGAIRRAAGPNVNVSLQII